MWSRPAEAAWADIPPGVWPMAYQPKSVLEIFCYGGASTWENFWVSEDMAAVKNWRNFQADVQNLNWHLTCTGTPSPNAEVNSFGTAPAGPPVFWGPATKPLWRPDIFSRAVTVVKAHDLQPHEAVTPLNLTGYRLGHPRLSGLGSKIQHRAMSQTPRTVPYSFVLAPDNIGIFGFGPLAAIANGVHPGYAQPMLVKIGDPSFSNLLLRSQMTPQADQLIRTYQGAYRDHLRFHGMGDAIRSAGFSSYDTAVNFLLHAADLNTLLSGGVLNVVNGRICGTAAAAEPPQQANRTKTSLEVATLLLTTGGARYVCVFDGGITGTYDSHDGPTHVTFTSSNIFNLCTHLAAQIDPTGMDATKLNLDNTIIVINSEFGRTPDIGDFGGRDHWPYGYPSVLIGGPITTRKIQGSLDAAATPAAATVLSPTDVHGAVLLAAGVDPFASENFGVGDFTTPFISDGTEQGTRLNLKTKVLGVP